MPKRNITKVNCDSCDEAITDSYWDFGTYGVVLCRECMVWLNAAEFAELLLSKRYPDEFKYTVNAHGECVKGW